MKALPPGATRWLRRAAQLASVSGALLLASLPVLAQDALQAVPPFKSFVTDLAGSLQSAERSQLEARLTAIEAESGSQLAVLIVPTTQPEDIAAYAIRVADAWKPGRRKVDDGVLLLIATQDRRLRIEVGRGLEGALPDATASRIIRETIAPDFQRGAFYAGIAAGVERIAERIGAEALPPPAPDEAGSWESALPLLLVVGFIALSLLRARRRAYYASGTRGDFAAAAAGAVLEALLRSGGRGGGWGGGGGGFGGGGGGGFGGGGASGGW